MRDTLGTATSMPFDAAAPVLGWLSQELGWRTALLIAGMALDYPAGLRTEMDSVLQLAVSRAGIPAGDPAPATAASCGSKARNTSSPTAT